MFGQLANPSCPPDENINANSCNLVLQLKTTKHYLRENDLEGKQHKKFCIIVLTYEKQLYLSMKKKEIKIPTKGKKQIPHLSDFLSIAISEIAMIPLSLTLSSFTLFMNVYFPCLDWTLIYFATLVFGISWWVK